MKRTVQVTQEIVVELDESKFDKAFFDEFNASFYDFGYDIDKHAEHLAQLFARGQWGHFIEGYGDASVMGIRCIDDYVISVES